MSDPSFEELPPPAPAESSGKYSVLAIVSFIAGLLSWFSVPLFFLVLPTPLCTLAAIICGHLARSELRREPALEGNWMAVTGLVLGWSMVVMVVLVVLAVVLFFGGLAAFLAYIGHVN